MSLKELFGGKRKDLAKTIDEAEAGEILLLTVQLLSNLSKIRN